MFGDVCGLMGVFYCLLCGFFVVFLLCGLFVVGLVYCLDGFVDFFVYQLVVEYVDEYIDDLVDVYDLFLIVFKKVFCGGGDVFVFIGLG